MTRNQWEPPASWTVNSSPPLIVTSSFLVHCPTLPVPTPFLIPNLRFPGVLNYRINKLFQIPPDLVEKSQDIDMAEIILSRIRRPNAVQRLCRNRDFLRSGTINNDSLEVTVFTDLSEGFSQPEECIQKTPYRL